MATWAHTALAAMVLAGVLGHAHLTATSVEPAVVVVHVRDYQHLDQQELTAAENAAASVYARIGVRLVWEHHNVRPTEPDGTLHVDVVVLNSEMTQRSRPAPAALGLGCHVTKRAVLYFPRIQAYALKSGTGFPRALGLVMAHELGHVLLPEFSHSASGLMRAELEGFVRRIPDFTQAEAFTIRTLLTASR
jgi:hypothetical protein